VKAAAHDDNVASPALAVGHGPRDPARHEGLAGVLLGALRLVLPERSKIGREPRVELLDRHRLLEEVVPERVAVRDSEPVAERGDALAGPRSAVGVAVLHAGKSLMPRGQIDEERDRSGPLGGLQRDPLRRVITERRPRRRRARCPHRIAEYRDREAMPERQLADPIVHVARPLDQHVARPRPLDHALDEARARGAVVPDADDAQGGQTITPGACGEPRNRRASGPLPSSPRAARNSAGAASRRPRCS